MHESLLLAHIARRGTELQAEFPAVQTGPGDDCAVVAMGAERLLLTTDHLVEGRHFEPLTIPHPSWMLDLIARKAIARSVSDIAAMAGEPVCALATVCLPHGFPQASASGLFDRVHAWAKHWHVPLVGGDLATFGAGASGVMVLTTTAVGRLTPRAGSVATPALRSDARAGHGVYVTGRLGGSLRELRHMLFEPRIEEAIALRDAGTDAGARCLGAMIDVSDGLGRDAARIAAMSGVRLELDGAALPRNHDAGWLDAARDGEDYELLFTWKETGNPPPPRVGSGATPVTRIGRVVEGSGCVIRKPDGAWLDAAELGWDHT